MIRNDYEGNACMNTIIIDLVQSKLSSCWEGHTLVPLWPHQTHFLRLKNQFVVFKKRSVPTHTLLRPAVVLQPSFTERKLAFFCVCVICVKLYVIRDGHFWLMHIWETSLWCPLYMCTPATGLFVQVFVGN